MAPELFDCRASFDVFAADVWALGIILFLLLTGMPPWDAATGTFVYERPKLHTTNHETVPELIENGDVELLNALLDCGHLPEGLDRPDPEFGLTAAYLAVTYDQPAVLDVLAARGCDLAKMCDGEGDDAYATPAFYAAYHGKVRCLEALVRLGVDATDRRQREDLADVSSYSRGTVQFRIVEGRRVVAGLEPARVRLRARAAPPDGARVAEAHEREV